MPRGHTTTDPSDAVVPHGLGVYDRSFGKRKRTGSAGVSPAWMYGRFWRANAMSAAKPTSAKDRSYTHGLAHGDAKLLLAPSGMGKTHLAATPPRSHCRKASCPAREGQFSCRQGSIVVCYGDV